MLSSLTYIFRRVYNKIALIPAAMGLLFAALAVYQVSSGNQLNFEDSGLRYFVIKDMDTIRTILATSIGGVFTLTIFTYTMVMSVLSQSISNYSPRLLPILLKERHQQIILGFMIGSIIHSILLFFGLVETNEQIDPPHLAAASVVIFTIISISLYVYFIYRVSQSVHINHILKNSYQDTRTRLEDFRESTKRMSWVPIEETPSIVPLVHADRPGYLSDVQLSRLASIAREAGVDVHLSVRPASFVYLRTAYLHTTGPVSDRQRRKLDRAVLISPEEPMAVFQNGFKHLTEVIVKAMSPGINDPGTALAALHYLTDLFLQFAQIKPHNCYTGKDGGRVFFRNWGFPEVLHLSITEIMTYGQTDPALMRTLEQSLQTLRVACLSGNHPEYVRAVDRELRDLPNTPTFSSAAPTG